MALCRTFRVATITRCLGVALTWAGNLVTVVNPPHPAIPETQGLLALGGSAGIVLTIKATSAVSDGCGVYVGEVGSQGGAWVGGTTQVVITDRVRPDWIIGRELLP